MSQQLETPRQRQAASLHDEVVDSGATLRVLSLGAGVQSTVLALLACEGVLPRPDAVIFADTGWEPRHTYEHLACLEEHLTQHNIPLYRVSSGSLRADSLDPDHRYASLPYHIRRTDRARAIGRRQCTAEYKIVPINRLVRQLLGAKAPHFRRVPRGRVAEQWIGFSTDELYRVNDRREVSYIRKRYPLLELGMSREACKRWLQRRGWGAVERSACVGCPYNGNARWRALRDTCACGHHRDEHRQDRPCPDGASGCKCGHITGDGTHRLASRCDCRGFSAPEWDDAVEFDRLIRKGGARGVPLQGEAFLHRSLLPLDQAPIDDRSRRERCGQQLDLLDEFGDPDGCSPYGCRSGSPVGAGDSTGGS